MSSPVMGAPPETPEAPPPRRQPLSPEARTQLRAAFVAQARSYVGIPYAKNNCRPEDEDAELFLDCCGLVRQVLRDMADDFGFQVGSGNQVRRG